MIYDDRTGRSSGCSIHGLPAFDCWVAIDWSGAMGQRHKGIALAIAAPGTHAPRIVTAPRPGGWARMEVADWLMACPGRVLAGFDFSFAPPFMDRGCYLPGIKTAETGPGFWKQVDACSTDADLGAAGFMTGAARPHFWMGSADGRKADYLRSRRCEQQFNASGGGKASTLFDCVGAAQVAKASFAGMRLLHLLRGDYAIWPFDPPADRTIVEIYTRAMIRLAGGSGRKLRDMESLNAALAALGSEAAAPGHYSDHETDVLLSAAALRSLSGSAHYWAPAAMTADIARTEGWTFGIA